MIKRKYIVIKRHNLRLKLPPAIRLDIFANNELNLRKF